jgi:predicted DNA-binding transcriptional regulator AlpA
MTTANQTTCKLTDPAMIEELRRAQEKFPLISIRETSKKYGVSIRTLRRWQAKGKMPEQVKHGRHLKYRKAEVELCISRHRRSDKPQEL